MKCAISHLSRWENKVGVVAPFKLSLSHKIARSSFSDCKSHVTPPRRGGMPPGTTPGTCRGGFPPEGEDSCAFAGRTDRFRNQGCPGLHAAAPSARNLKLCKIRFTSLMLAIYGWAFLVTNHLSQNLLPVPITSYQSHLLTAKASPSKTSRSSTYFS